MEYDDEEELEPQNERTDAESDDWDDSAPAAFLPIVGNVHRSRTEILASLGDVNPNGKRQKRGRRRKHVQRPRSIGPREQIPLNKIDGYVTPGVHLQLFGQRPYCYCNILGPYCTTRNGVPSQCVAQCNSVAHNMMHITSSCYGIHRHTVRHEYRPPTYGYLILDKALIPRHPKDRSWWFFGIPIEMYCRSVSVPSVIFAFTLVKENIYCTDVWRQGRRGRWWRHEWWTRTWRWGSQSKHKKRILYWHIGNYACLLASLAPSRVCY